MPRNELERPGRRSAYSPRARARIRRVQPPLLALRLPRQENRWRLARLRKRLFARVPRPSWRSRTRRMRGSSVVRWTSEIKCRSCRRRPGVQVASLMPGIFHTNEHRLGLLGASAVLKSSRRPALVRCIGSLLSRRMSRSQSPYQQSCVCKRFDLPA